LNREPLNLFRNMNVHVSLFANLRDYSPGEEGSFDLRLDSGATIADLMAALHIPPVVQAVVLVNGRRAEPTCPLAPEDGVTLFPPMEGG
jgi:molybdopterin converting factor small subunit